MWLTCLDLTPTPSKKVCKTCRSQREDIKVTHFRHGHEDNCTIKIQPWAKAYAIDRLNKKGVFTTQSTNHYTITAKTDIYKEKSQWF